jgi:hypothetical protein
MTHFPNNNATSPEYFYSYIPWPLDFQNIKFKNNTIQQCKRVALVALSFASLHPRTSPLISVSMGTIRGASCIFSYLRCKDNKASTKASTLLHVTLAVVSVAGTLFKHRLGLGITAGHEALLNGYALGYSLWMRDLHSALANSLLLANNSLYIATLFYCSLEIVFISLALQILVQGYKAYQEFRKGNSLEGYAHLLTGVIRLYQNFLSVEILLLKWFIKADFEIWKEKLSPDEHTIVDHLSMKYLYFKKGDKREKFLILCAEDDPKDALNPEIGPFLKDITKLSTRFEVKFRTISRIEDIRAEIELAAQAGKITGFMLRGHGNPLFIILGSDPVSGTLRIDNIPSGTFSKLDPKCVIVLDSCRTAQYPNGIAYEIASQSQRVTYAATSIVGLDEETDMRLVSLNPLEWQFDSTGINTKIIRSDTL